jgi:hypothetical protein
MQVLHQAFEVFQEVHKQPEDALHAQPIWVPKKPGQAADA